MEVDGVYALRYEPKTEDRDEIAVKWDDHGEEYVILTRNGLQEEFLHEDGTWRKPKQDALVEAWAVVKSMNRRVSEGHQRRRNKL